MERNRKIGTAFNRSKFSFMGGIAVVGEGFAALGQGMADMLGVSSVDLANARNRTRRHFSVEEDPTGRREGAAALRGDFELVGADMRRAIKKLGLGE